jgi:hypothetical protein
MDQYPGLFDTDDLRLTRTQPRYHFNEWYAAIHILQVSGALSLIEKYTTPSAHPRKRRLLQQILSSRQGEILDEIVWDYRVNPPDLLVYSPDHERFWFVEVKGPRDRLMKGQIRSHTALRRRLKVPVQVMDIVLMTTPHPLY